MSRHAIREGVERALAAADAPEASHVFTLRLDEMARAEADAADAGRLARSRLPFLGVPITIKDNIDLAGYATTAGSVVLRDAPPAERDAPLVSRLRQNGFVLLGRTNMTEFAFSGLGLNPHHGSPANPAIAGEARIAGGSSSGAAVSVALDIAPLAIGTDTGGSIRIPAALCGLAGFKPTAGAIDRGGVLPLSTTLDAVGMIGRSVSDCAALFEALRDSPRSSRRTACASRLRLGLVTNYVTQDLDTTTASAFDAAITKLSRAGVGIESLSLPEFDAIPAMLSQGTLPGAEAFAWHETLLSRRDEYDPLVLERIEAGGRMGAVAYVRLVEARRALIESIGSRTWEFDALVWPTVPTVAPTIASLADPDAYRAANARMLRNPSVVNLLDGCAFSIPCPDAQAPVGLSLAAGRGQDDRLIAVATRIESILKGAGHASHQGT